MTDGIIDLHTHSAYSDGTQTPRELLAAADEINLKAVALTDHDTVEGIPDFLEAAGDYPDILAIPGLEMSTIYKNREVHILGLFLAHNCPELQEFLGGVRLRRRQRNEIMAAKLTSLGYPVDIEELREICKGQVVGRPHFADYLIKNYDFEKVQDVFDRLLKRGAPAFVPRSLPSPVNAIKLIHKARGLAVWAHPVYRKNKERSWCRKVLKELVPAGLDAIEAYYTGFNEYQTQMIKGLAAEFGIALAGGSDCHGGHHPDISMGKGYGNLNVPADIIPELLRRKEQKDTEV